MPTVDDRSASMGYQLNLAARLMGQLLASRIAQHGVAPGQFAQLLALYDHDGQTAAELSAAVAIEPGTMTKTLQRMERDGLIERGTDPHDRRQVRIHLTARARSLEPVMRSVIAEVNAQALHGLSDERKRSLMLTLERVIGNAEASLGRQ